MPSRIRTYLALAGLAGAMLIGVVTGAPSSSPAASFLPKDQVAASLHAMTPKNNKRVTMAASAAVTYRVKSGDTLSSIAKTYCGHSGHWPNLWWSNKKLIHNPNQISVGWKLTMSACDGQVTHKVERRAYAAIPVPKSASPVKLASAPVAAPQQPAAASTVSTSGMGSFQSCVIQAESGGNPTIVNSSSGAGGLYQFLLSTWDSLGFGAQYPGGAQTAPVSVQNAAFAKEYAQSGTSAWSAYDGC